MPDNGSPPPEEAAGKQPFYVEAELAFRSTIASVITQHPEIKSVLVVVNYQLSLNDSEIPCIFLGADEPELRPADVGVSINNLITALQQQTAMLYRSIEKNIATAIEASKSKVEALQAKIQEIDKDAADYASRKQSATAAASPEAADAAGKTESDSEIGIRESQYRAFIIGCLPAELYIDGPILRDYYGRILSNNFEWHEGYLAELGYAEHLDYNGSFGRLWRRIDT